MDASMVSFRKGVEDSCRCTPKEIDSEVSGTRFRPLTSAPYVCVVRFRYLSPILLGDRTYVNETSRGSTPTHTEEGPKVRGPNEFGMV